MDTDGTTRHAARIGLGTVQLGMDYGVTNDSGQPSLDEAARIFRVAREYGVRVVDTAATYGNSEEVIGQTLDRESPFRIITKCLPLDKSAIGSCEIDLVRESFTRSLDRLQVSRVDGVLVHHAPDLLADDGNLLWDYLCELRDEGLTNKIGASVYDPEQLSAILNRCDVDLVQLPLNVLDQRWTRDGQLEAMHEAGIEIHARSAFLQGVLLAKPEELPKQFEPLRGHLEQYHEFRRDHQFSAIGAALGFVLNTPVDCVVVGAARADDFEGVLKTAASLPEELPDFRRFACDDPRFINPTQWAA